MIFKNVDKKSKKHVLKVNLDDVDKESKEAATKADTILALEWDILSSDYLLVARELSGLRLVDVENETTICHYKLPSRALCIKTLSWIPDGRGLFATGGSCCFISSLFF